MKILQKQPTLGTYHCLEGDIIQLYCDDEEGNRIKVAQEVIKKPILINSTVIFEVEKGDFGEDVECGIGGAFLQTKKVKK